MRAAIVAAWNADPETTMAEIGERFGMPRASVGRILTEERALGHHVRRMFERASAG